MDKITIKFFADLMYIKGIICFDEYEDIMSCCTEGCLDKVIEKMLKDEYNPYLRGDIIV